MFPIQKFEPEHTTANCQDQEIYLFTGFRIGDFRPYLDRGVFRVCVFLSKVGTDLFGTLVVREVVHNFRPEVALPTSDGRQR
jgi:hypothetical protein